MKSIRCIVCFFFVVTLIASFAIPVGAAEIKNVNDGKSYDIAVVYDNSGSMYHDESWCRAKYAVEIFASMLDYGKAKSDKLTIFPMWKVLTDGSTPGSDKEPETSDLGLGSIKPITIQSVKDIDKISKMYTTQVGDTPLEPIDEAAEYLNSSNATDKWLIILTDGEFNQEKRADAMGDALSSDKLREKLIGKSSSDVKVQYLGFGEASALEGDGKNFYAATCNATNLQDNLISVCNTIFQRSILKGKLSGKKLNLELSMKKLIVFVQGENAEVKSLKADKNEIGILQNSGQRTYSTCDMPWWAHKVDKSLAGQVVTFDKCKKGTYTLNYSGADANRIQIFYEPDIDLNVEFSAESKAINLADGELLPGKYKIHYNLLDGATGEDITNDTKALELLGGDVQLGATAKSSIYDNTPIENDGEFELVADDPTTMAVDGSYLGGKYLIHYDIDLSANKPAELPFAMKLTIEQDDAWYVLKEHKKWKPIHADFTLDGKKLTSEEMARVNIGAAFTPDITYHVEYNENASSADIYIAVDNDGVYTEPETSEYTAKITSLYEDEYGRAQEVTGDVDFTINSMSKAARFWLTLLIILLILAALAALIWFILSRKILPKEIYTMRDETEFSSNGNPIEAKAMKKRIKFFERFSKNGTAVTIKSPMDAYGAQMSPVKLKIKPISTVKDVIFNKKQAKVQATLANPAQTISGINLAGIDYEYSKEKNNFVNGDDMLCTESPVKLSNGSMFEFDETSTNGTKKTKLNYVTTIRMKW